MTTVTGVSEFVAGAGNGHRLQWRLTMVTGQGTYGANKLRLKSVQPCSFPLMVLDLILVCNTSALTPSPILKN